LFNPRAVEALPDGNWVVLDRTNRIQIFTPEGEYIRHWTTPATGRGNPRGLDVDHRGNILVADTHYSQVLRYTPAGELLQTIGHPGTGPGEFGLVTDVVEDASGFLTTLEYGEKVRVQRLDREGRFVREWGKMGTAPGELRRAQGLDLTPEGNIAVADSVNHRIQIFDVEGQLLACWGEFGTEPGKLNYPYDVSVDKAGRIYVIEFGNHRLQVFNQKGQSLLCLGGPGRGYRQFNEPWGVTVLPSGSVVVADTRNDRLQNLGPLF
jgi:DNA-binding beta-propeller fold protein YncE